MNIVEKIKEAIGDDKVLTGEQLSDRYSHFWHMDENLRAKALVTPSSTDDVSNVLRICHEESQPVVVHGGLTNLVGSTVSTDDDVIISLEKMSQIEEIDEVSRTVTAQAGVVLETVQRAADEKGLLLPLNFGAKGSAQVGGVISTNAGGLRVFRYGMTRQLVLGLEAVLADGTVINSLKKIIKDNSGYDLKQLFIGSEGSLGIVTKAVFRLFEKPSRRCSAFVSMDNFPQVQSFLKLLGQKLQNNLSGYELIWGDTYKTMTSPPASPKPPLPDGSKYYVLIETLGSSDSEDQAMLQCLEMAMEKNIITDAVKADGDSDMQWFWRIREDVHVLSSVCAYDQHFDISLPLVAIGDTIDMISEELAQQDGVEHVFTFGHVADGNIHYIIGKDNDSNELKERIDRIVYTPLKALGGSVSAEHGIGTHKKKHLTVSRTDEELLLMKRLKNALDPHHILNRGKIFDV